jgi:hypothetical protein
LIIDIKDVMLISQEGENALLQLINHGAKFRPDGVLAKLILQQLAHRSKKQLSDLIDANSRPEDCADRSAALLHHQWAACAFPAGLNR